MKLINHIIAPGLALLLIGNILNVALAKIPEENKMFFSENASATKFAAADISKYEYTAQILRNRFGKDDVFINKFYALAIKSGITLDALFKGEKDSKKFTAEGRGYDDAQRAKVIDLAVEMVNQQLSITTPSDHPTYSAFIGAPGSGKTFAIIQERELDIPHGKFANDNSVVVGPDLVVMEQLPEYRAACEIPDATARAAAIEAVYSLWRDASNAAANLTLLMALLEHRNITHDSTMTSDTVDQLLATIGQPDIYEPDLHYFRRGRLLVVDRADRQNSLELRKEQKKGFALVKKGDDKELGDAVVKGKMLYKRIGAGSYIGGFDELVICMQPPQFYKGKPQIEIAKYDPTSKTMQILPGCDEHVKHIVEQAQAFEDLEPEVFAAFAAKVATWKRAPEITSVPKYMPAM